MEMNVPEFQGGNHRVARNYVVRLFFHHIGFTHCISTHVAQKNHVETESAYCKFMEFMSQKVGNMNSDPVLNRDQTPISFAFHSNCTWSEKGMHTFHINDSTSDTKRAMLAAIVKMSSNLLHPFLIFKGKENDRIATKELPTFPIPCKRRHGWTKSW